MKSRITKFAAAVIIIAVGVTFTLIGNGPALGNVNWEQVAQNLQKSKTLKFKWSLIVDEIPFWDFTWIRSAEFGVRQERYIKNKLTDVCYFPARGTEWVWVFPDQKEYIFNTGAERRLDNFMQIDLSLMVTKMKEREYVEIGSKTIDGIECEGIKFTNVNSLSMVNGTGEFWVDPQTNMPLLLTHEGDNSDGQHLKMVADQFEWTELTAEDFKPNIPADYKPSGIYEGVSDTEESAILGLKGFAELSDGKYPSSLALSIANREARGARWNKIFHAAGGVAREATQQEKQQFLGHKNICHFYAKLLYGANDVAYYGKTVIVGDADQVLLRWRLEDGQYRVIFGDLHTENVDAQRLTELEEKYLTLDLGNGIRIKLVLIPDGEFMMGSLPGESGHEDYEGPQHQVKLTKAFYMGVTEVTQQQYTMGANPSTFQQGSNNPVDNVSWDDA
ncbi:MAG: SUMF1/EgtB/PvdO family nonheme iron enzyme, partial [Planctomycetes bacterium]|nr:SUMF1/EgtB/PvdO family nonheme iron enzyme [Planctomycetota bacterium]